MFSGKFQKKNLNVSLQINFIPSNDFFAINKIVEIKFNNRPRNSHFKTEDNRIIIPYIKS